MFRGFRHLILLNYSKLNYIIYWNNVFPVSRNKNRFTKSAKANFDVSCGRCSMDKYTLYCHSIHMCFLKIHFTFAGIMAFLLPGSLSTRFWSLWQFALSATRALVSDMDDRQEGLACCQHSNSSQKWLLGLRSWLCEGHSRSSTPALVHHVFTLCMVAFFKCWMIFG